MKKCISIFAIILIVAILCITGRNNANSMLVGDPPIGTSPLPKINSSKSELIIIKAEITQFRFQQENMI